ncbi:MAG: hypothetical protein EOM24_24030 [Chloroflexia bacterium]|nr:hypothetical protein [Chloroflexia bacterium]
MATLPQLADALDASWQQLDQRWREASEQWCDDTQRAFAHEHWQPLEQHAALTRRELKNVIAAIERARQSLR